MLGKGILKLHIKEYGKFKQFDVRLFEGDDNWPAIMKAPDAVGYQGWGISEQPGEQSQDAAGLKDLDGLDVVSLRRSSMSPRRLCLRPPPPRDLRHVIAAFADVLFVLD